jgi:hypothetical protein
MEEKQMLDGNDQVNNWSTKGKRKGKPMLLLVGVSLVVVLGAAYVLGRYIRGDGSHGESSTIVDMAGGVTITQLEVAEELPKTQPAIWGMVDRIQDNSVFVTQLPPLEQIAAQKSVDFGPTIEVVVTNKTIIYEVPPSNTPTNGVVHEKVIPGSVDEIGESHLVSVWGERRGDRIVADVLKYNTHTKIVLPSGPIN